jgi:hypothetical protein
MSTDIPNAIRLLVRQRAKERCEYCLLHEADAWEAHQPDHVIAIKHRGLTVVENLAWTCSVCNLAKGSDIASLDPRTDKLVRLFHPRQDRGSQHFQLDNGLIVPKTAIGRVTEFILKFNRFDRVRVRRILIDRGLYLR